MFAQLYLSPLAAVYQKHLVLDFQHLGRRVGKGPWGGGIATEYG